MNDYEAKEPSREPEIRKPRWIRELKPTVTMWIKDSTAEEGRRPIGYWILDDREEAVNFIHSLSDGLWTPEDIIIELSTIEFGEP